jgi:hypothetical protein
MKKLWLRPRDRKSEYKQKEDEKACATRMGFFIKYNQGIQFIFYSELSISDQQAV